MISRDIDIVNKLGLHARAAAKLVKLSSSFASSIDIQKDDQRVNSKSIMGVMMLAASHGTRVTLHAEGPDEQVRRYLALGRSEGRRSHWEAAQTHLEEAAQLRPELLEVQRELADALVGFHADVAAFHQALDEQEAAWKAQKTTNGELKRAVDRLAPLAETSFPRARKRKRPASKARTKRMRPLTCRAIARL